jgi:hypothetical protein
MGKNSSAAVRKTAAKKAAKQAQQGQATRGNDRVRKLLKQALGSKEGNGN